MPQKEPVLLVVLIDTTGMRWRMGGIGEDGSAFPLIASQPDDLSFYRPLTYDEQASFLRHRFCGVLQRGCDRLWGLMKKAKQFVLLIDGDFPDAPPELTARTADHLAGWMVNPPLSFHRVENCSAIGKWNGELVTVAGELDEASLDNLKAGLLELAELAQQPAHWEEAPLPQQ